MSQRKKEALITLAVIMLVVAICTVMGVFHFSIMQRLHPEMDMVTLLQATLDDIIKHPFDFRGLTKDDVIMTAGILMIFAMFAMMAYGNAVMRDHYASDKVQGDQKLMTDLRSYNRRYTDPIGKTSHNGPNNLILSKDLFLCMDNEKTQRNLNILIIGGSGAGKSYNFVGPNIMQANASFVVTDPSGGLFKRYGRFLEYMGYKVKCFNLSQMDQGNRYNPFNYIHSNLDVEILVNCLIENTTPPEKKGGDPFWEKSETALLVALVAYLYNHASKECQNFTNVMRLIHAADIDENDSNSKSQLDVIFDEIKDPEDFAKKQYLTFKIGAGKTLKSILISSAVRLSQFDLEDVANLTSSDDIDLDRIGDEKTALFIIMKTGDNTFAFLASLMYSQLFHRLYEYSEFTAEFSQLIIDSDKQVWKTFRAGSSLDAKNARAEAESYFERAKKATIRLNPDYQWYEMVTDRGELVGYRGSEKEAQKALEKLREGKVISNAEQSNQGQRLPIHTRLLCDEFANIGKIPDFNTKLSTVRKYELSCCIIIQSLSQIKYMYEKEWEAITGNCDNFLYLGGGIDDSLFELVSKLLGKETRTVMNLSFGHGGGGTSFNRIGMEVMTLGQIRKLPSDECLVIPRSEDGYRGKKYQTRKHPMNKLVVRLNKKYGSYYFQSQKAKDLYEQTLLPERAITDEHGSVIEEAAETVALENANDEIAAGEYKQNGDANGVPVIGSNRSVRKGGKGLEETVPLENADEKKKAVLHTVKGLETLWEPDEIIYGDTRADSNHAT